MKILFDYRVIQLIENNFIKKNLQSIVDALLLHDNITIFFLVTKKFSLGFYNEFPDNIIFDEELDNFSDKIYFNFFFTPIYFYYEPLMSLNKPTCDIIIPNKIFKICEQCTGIISSISPFTRKINKLSFKEKIQLALEFDNLFRIKHFFYFSDYTKSICAKLLNKTEDLFYPLVDNNSNLQITSCSNAISNNAVAIYGNQTDDISFQDIIQCFMILYTNKAISETSTLYLYNITSSQQKKLNQLINDNASIKNKIIIVDNKKEQIFINVNAHIYLTFEDHMVFSLYNNLINQKFSYVIKKSPLAEFIHPTYQFDISNQAELKLVLLQAFQQQFFNSLNYQTKLYSLTLENISNKLYNSLQYLKKNFIKKRRIAVFSPEKGAVAEFATKIFTTKPLKIDFFAEFTTINQYDHFLNYTKTLIPNIYPFSCYNELSQSTDYTAKIFLFGDSYFHKQVFDEAVKTKGDKNRFALFAEPLVHGMISTYLNWNSLDEIKSNLNKYYPEKKDIIQSITGENIYDIYKKNFIGLLRIVASLTGINNFIFYGRLSRAFAEKDLNKQPINIYEIPVPLERVYCSDIINFKTNSYIVGTFGIPSHLKQTELVYQAVQLLNNKGMNVKLLLAGPGITDYIKRNKYDETNLIIYDSPDKKTWLALLNSIDLGIQLRPHAIAATSGCIAELGCLGKKMIVTKGTNYEIFTPLCSMVDDNVSAEELAQTIITCKNNKEKVSITNEQFDKISYNNVAEKIINIINQQR